MALHKLFTKRIFNGIKTTASSASSEHAIVSSPSLQQTLNPPNASKTNFHREYLSSPGSTHRGFYRRFLLRPAVYHSGTGRLPEFLSLPVGEKLRERLNSLVRTGDRLRLGDLNLAPVKLPATSGGSEITVKNARKILKASQMEKVKVKLRDIPENSVSYSEFLRICVESCENHEQGVEFAKLLDDAGNVIVLGNVVFLRPEQVFCSVLSS